MNTPATDHPATGSSTRSASSCRPLVSSQGDIFGLEVAANDDDDGGERDTKWGWWAPVGTDEAWQRPSVFGKAKLQPTD